MMIPGSFPASPAPGASPDTPPSSPRLSWFWPQGFSQTLSSSKFHRVGSSLVFKPLLKCPIFGTEPPSGTREPHYLSTSVPHGPLFQALEKALIFSSVFHLMSFVCLFMRNARSVTGRDRPPPVCLAYPAQHLPWHMVSPQQVLTTHQQINSHGSSGRAKVRPAQRRVVVPFPKDQIC